MSAGEAGKLAVTLIGIAVLIYAWFQLAVWCVSKVKDAKEAGQARARADVLRLQKLVEIADQIDAANTTGERQKLYREAELLGFLDSDDLPHRPAA